MCVPHTKRHTILLIHSCVRQHQCVREYVCICMLYLCTRTPSVCNRVPGRVYGCTHMCIHTAASAASQHIPWRFLRPTRKFSSVENYRQWLRKGRSLFAGLSLKYPNIMLRARNFLRLPTTRLTFDTVTVVRIQHRIPSSSTQVKSVHL